MTFVLGSHIGIRTKAESFQNAPKANFDFYVISFICTNFESFTTFSSIFTRIQHTGTITYLYIAHYARAPEFNLSLNFKKKQYVKLVDAVVG